MSREIKFRFWHKRWNRFEDAGYMFGTDGPQFPTDITIPLQYTGLKDKNGREIYEGDILRHPNRTKLAVQWTTGPYRTGWNINHGEKCEVIGNIYENPELLK